VDSVSPWTGTGVAALDIGLRVSFFLSSAVQVDPVKTLVGTA